MILKSTTVENNLSLLKELNLILLYGENVGLKNDIKEKIKLKAKDSEIIILFQEEILQKKNLLEREINNLSLFDIKKIIIINEANDKIFETISSLEDQFFQSCKVMIFSDVLEKRSKLRNYFEKEKKVGIIPCYKDNKIQLKDYIFERLKGYKGLGIEIVNMLIDNSNCERETVRNEITKIQGFYLDKMLDKNSLERLLNYKKTTDENEIIDASLSKKSKDLNNLLGSQLILENDIFKYIFKLDQKISTLIQIKLNQKNNNSIDEAIEKIKPNIFWKDKPNYINQAKVWELHDLILIREKISEIELIMKSKSEIKKEVLFKNLLVEVAKK